MYMHIRIYICMCGGKKYSKIKNLAINKILSVHTVVYLGANLGLAYSTKSSIKTGHAPGKKNV